MTESLHQLDVLDLEDFESSLGNAFVLIDGTGELILRDAKAVGQGHPGRAVPFSLLFDGPLDQPLGQGIHRLETAELGRLDVFLVPVGITAQARQYEAIFN